MADAHANGAYSTVATAPSPAISGTSLTLATGDGARFPSVGSFPVTVWATGAQPIFVAGSGTVNAEVVRASRSGDVLTLTRAQEGTSARTIVVGDQVIAGITAKTLTDVEANAMRYQGAFDSSAGYAVNDVVKWQNKLYVCTSAVTAGATSAFVASRAVANASTITLPTGSAAGDLVILTQFAYTGGAGPTKPSYATQINATSTSFGIINVSSYVLQTADITAGTLAIPTQTGTASVAMMAHAFRNVTRGVDSTVASTATLLTAAVTPTDACFLLEVAGMVNSSGTGLLTASWSPGGYVNYSAGGANTADVAGGYETLAAGATSSVRTFVNPAGSTGGATVVVPILTGAGFNLANWTELASDNAIVISGTPTAGQVPVASSGTAAAWAMPGRGGALSPAGAAFETFPRNAVPAATNISTANGTLQLAAIWLPAGFNVGHLAWMSNSAGNSFTHWWFGLYDSNRVQLATTADQTSGAWAANTRKSLAVATIASGAASSFTTTYAGLYYIGLCNVVTITNIGLLGLALGSGLSAVVPILYGTSDTSQTTPPAFPHTAGTITPVDNMPYASAAA